MLVAMTEWLLSQFHLFASGTTLRQRIVDDPVWCLSCTGLQFLGRDVVSLHDGVL